MNRRTLLKALTAGVASSGMAGTFGGFAANAANTAGYKAIVCLFLKGGMDAHDTLMPYDQSSYNRYADIRRAFMNADGGLIDGPLRSRNALLELNPANAAEFGSRSFALPPSLSGLHSLFERGNASIVANAGPLLAPINATQYNENRTLRPSKLFSHNDQQSTWMALAAEGQKVGWGGRFADAMLAANANANPGFTAITVTGNEVFLSGNTAIQYKISSNGVESFDELEKSWLLRGATNDPAILAEVEAHFNKSSETSGNLFSRDMADVFGRATNANRAYTEATDALEEFATPFPESSLGGQLRSVARTIAARGALGARRQVFFVAKGGFDTHSRQVLNMRGLHQDIDASVTAFYAALEELGIENDVVLFTSSDFGRTLTLNGGSGTDHGWSGHHFVVGGSVDGGKIFGDVPPFDLDHEYDVGRGRMIPTTSVEQFAAPIGRWFGLSEAELGTALPNLQAFNSAPAFV